MIAAVFVADSTALILLIFAVACTGTSEIDPGEVAVELSPSEALELEFDASFDEQAEAWNEELAS